MRAVVRSLGSVLIIATFILLLTGVIKLLKSAWFGPGKSGNAQVAVLDISGVIFSSASFSRDLDEILEDKGIKALVVRINSPGGLVGPSQELFHAIENADKQIPVVVSMGALAASGGYYAALGGRKIYANPGTLTASIGVIMEFANTEKLYQWAKVERYALKAGKFKDAGSPLRPMSPEDRNLLQAMLKDVHDQFRGAVKEKRKLSPEELEVSTDGRVMTGSQAKTAKLVDELGGFEDALSEAKRIAKLPDDAVVRYPEVKGSFIRRLLLGDQESRWDRLMEGLLERFPEEGTVHPGWRVLLLSPVR